LVTHYSIDPASKSLFNAVMGPIKGVRLFIIRDKFASVGKRLLEHIHYDILRFMSQETGEAVISRYHEMVHRATISRPWQPTWYERQLTSTKDEQEESEPTGKRKKTNPPNAKIATPESTVTHHTDTQKATKILSNAAAQEEHQGQKEMANEIATLKEKNVELITMIGEMKEFQHRDQTRIIGIQSDLDNTNKRIEAATKEIRKCALAVTTVESRLALLSTKEETTNRFDRIESLLMGNYGINQ
jgi:hypothetical protein